MKVRYLCGYYSDLAHKNIKRRPEDYWDAYFFCWLVKMGGFRRSFYIHEAGKKIQVTRNNFKLARATFGKFISKAFAKFEHPDAILVPIPSKDGAEGSSPFRTLEMTKEALQGSALVDKVIDALRWNEKEIAKAHEGGTRSRAGLAPLLAVKEGMKGKTVILVDDLLTTGSSLLAASDALEKVGVKIAGAIVCGKTIYDLKTPPFGDEEFDLTNELADWKNS